MSITIKQITPAIGAIVEGIQLSESLSQDNLAFLQDILFKYQILFFRNQPITPQQQLAFAANFGDLHIHPIYPVLPELPEIMLIDTHEGFLPDNDNWHTDVTFSQTPPLGAVLAAKQLPSVGGDTLWSSNSAAYEALSEPFKQLLDGLTAQHSVVKSFPADRWASGEEAQAKYNAAVAKHPIVNHPVVRTHPVTGRKGIFVSEGFTTRINELNQRESDLILNYLYTHIAKPEFTLRWNWQVNDIAFWDNRITQHYAVADYLPERRIMHRATIVGDKPY
jgi:taurine dioxygenase